MIRLNIGMALAFASNNDNEWQIPLAQLLLLFILIIFSSSFCPSVVRSPGLIYEIIMKKTK
jgi:hypothetical protein